MAYQLIGRGVYTPADAAWLTGVPVRRIRHWISGRRYRASQGEIRRSPAAVQSELPEELRGQALLFADLHEVRWVHFFLESGVSWTTIRSTAAAARTALGVTHPFSSQRFQTDGHTILLQLGVDLPQLLDLVRGQFESDALVSPFLKGTIDYENDAPVRWWPVVGSHRIVLDPRRSFGAPIVHKEGVPTRVLARAAKAEESIETASTIWEVEIASVREAVRFEQRAA